MHPHQTLILIKGVGDLASGVAARLHRCGFPVVMTELPQPAMVRRAVCFGEAIYEGAVRVEEIVGRRVANPADARAAWENASSPSWLIPKPAA